MKLFFSIALIFCASGLFAFPLEGGYALAPNSTASKEEKALAYMNARRKVIEAATNYLGTPYKYGGMSASGMDCSGFLCQSFKEALGVSLPRSSSSLYTWTVRVTLEKAQPGDFLFFRTGTGSGITHVGLYLGSRKFIHAASSGPKTGVIYSDMDERYWANAYAGAGRAFPEAPADFKIDEKSSLVTNDADDSENSQAAANRKRRTPLFRQTADKSKVK